MLITNNGGNYKITELTTEEQEALAWTLENHQTKLEKFISEFLASRLVNKRYQENQMIIAGMTSEEKSTIKDRIIAAATQPVIDEEIIAIDEEIK